jgi:hypothetical protein
MTETIIKLETEQDVDRAQKMCETVFKLGKPYEVSIRTANETLSGKQRRLYWTWMTDIEKSGITGNTKDDMHEFYKYKFLVGIYCRADEQYNQMVDAVREVRKTDPKRANILRDQIVVLTSITDANKDQMREYLSLIDNHAQVEIGVTLSRPEDLYYASMGVKK